MQDRRVSFTSALAIAAVVCVASGFATWARAEVVCDPTPLTDVDGCRLAGKSKVSIHDDPDPASSEKDNMRWSWLKGDTISEGGLGNPMAATEYAVCIYDSDAGVYTLVKDLQIPASGALWSVKSENGFQFTDNTMGFDGVLSLRLRADAQSVGKSQVKMKVRGINFDPPGPPIDQPLEYFKQDPSVIVNLVNSEGTCWTTEYFPENNRKFSAKDFRALTD